MISDSVFLMTLIDAVYLVGAAYLIRVFLRWKKSARTLGVLPALFLIITGLLIFAVFHFLDLLTMHALPRWTSPTLAMQFMTELHLNWSWFSNLLTAGLLTGGFIYLVSKLIPRASAAMEDLEDAAARSQTELQTAFERLELATVATNDGVWEEVSPSRDGYGHGWWSPRYRALVGFDSNVSLEGDEHWRVRLHPEDADRVYRALAAHLLERTQFDVECRLHTQSGEFRWFRLRGQASWDDRGIATRMAGSIQDIAEQRRHEQHRRELELAVENAMTGISRLDREGRFTEVRPGYAAMLGHEDPGELVGRSWTETVVPEDHSRGREGYEKMRRQGRSQVQLRACRRDGSEFRKEILLVQILDEHGAHDGHYCFMRDVTEAHRLTERLSHQASHDALTGLINRGEFEQRLSRIIETAKHSERTHALLYIDLDQFKIINDTCGHGAGDELLRQLGQILKTKVRTRDTLARLGGDEFGVLLEHCSPKQAIRVAEDLRSTAEDFSFQWEGKTFGIGASIGVVAIDKESGTLNDLLKAADTACYAAKDAGRNQIRTYTADDAELAARYGEMQWVARISRALTDKRLVLYRQPVVPINAEDESVTRFELLIRLLDESGKLVPPGAFLPAAERYGLVSKLDQWVLNRALEWLHKDTTSSAIELCHINVSGPSLASEEFLNSVIEGLDHTRLDPAKLCFEITETAAISDLTGARRFIEACRARGCRFALDDFGSGLSSFGYLKNLPVDFVKIAGVFVRDMLNDPIDLAMVRSIHDVARVTGKLSIAEYVESRAIFEALGDIGVDYAQGFWLGRPQPLEEVHTGQHLAKVGASHGG